MARVDAGGGDAPERGILARFVSGRLVLVLGVLVAAGLALMLVPKKSSTDLRSLGVAIIASAIVYALVSVFYEPQRALLQEQRSVSYAINRAYEMFYDRFERALPVAAFPQSKVPQKEFRDAFAKLLLESGRYELKGTTGEFASFRLSQLANCCPELRRMDIRLYLLDPSDGKLGEAHALLRLRNGALGQANPRSIQEQMDKTSLDTFVTLMALYDIRTSLSTTVYFHRDLPFFRIELFDDGVFLAYYQEPTPYPQTLQFKKDAWAYESYRTAVDLTHRFPAQPPLAFGQASRDSVETEEDFHQRLAELGCQYSISDLRVKAKERMDGLQKTLADAGISPDEIF